MGKFQPIRKVREYEEWLHYRENSNLWWRLGKHNAFRVTMALVVVPVTIYHIVKREMKNKLINDGASRDQVETLYAKIIPPLPPDSN
jgi:hypothetical protein